MRQLFLIFLFFSLTRIYSMDCDPIEFHTKYSAQTFVSNTKGEITVKLAGSAFNEDANLSCRITNLQAKGVEVTYYSTSPCNTTIPFKTSTFNSLNFKLIEIPSYTNYIKFKNLSESKCRLKLELEEPKQKQNCNYFLNSRNSFENPVLIEETTTSFFINDCNTGCPSGKKVDRPIKWYEIEVLDDIFIEFIEQGSQNFFIEYYGVKNNIAYFVQEQYFNDGIFLDVSDFQSIRIGIYSNILGKEAYNFQVKRYKHNTSCVDFIGEGDTLITTSNSLITGTNVFKAGEVVTFQYKLLSWTPINQNWIHGLSVEFGDGWEGFEVDSTDGKPDLQAFSVDKGIQNVIRLNFEEDEDYYKKEGINQGNLYIPGFYLNADKAGPKGPNSSFKWGKKLGRIKGDIDNPLVTFEFKLVAKEVLNCEKPLDGFVQVVPTSDYYTGRHKKSGCEETQGAEIQAEIVCCENPALIANAMDTVFCEGDEVYFSFKDTVEWKISESVKGRGMHMSIKEYINQSDIDSLQITFKPVNQTICIDSFVHDFYSVQRPDHRNLTRDNHCKHEQIDLTKLLKLKPDEEIVQRGNYNDVINKHFVSKDIEILDLVVKDTFGCETPVKIEFQSDPDCNKPLLTGILNPNPMVNYSRLYITNKTTDPMVKVLILNSNKDFVDQFSVKVPEDYNGFFDFESRNLYAGEYFINLSNSESNFTFSFIKVN
ncbi:MAG: hypothetical protein P1U56_01830 [Saprospiraceae bacterium]|nr:hypothetical protein [Saprospiraceae bacterium]